MKINTIALLALAIAGSPAFADKAKSVGPTACKDGPLQAYEVWGDDIREANFHRDNCNENRGGYACDMYETDRRLVYKYVGADCLAQMAKIVPTDATQVAMLMEVNNFIIRRALYKAR